MYRCARRQGASLLGLGLAGLALRPADCLADAPEASATAHEITVDNLLITRLDAPALGVARQGSTVWVLTSKATLQAYELSGTGEPSLVSEAPAPAAVALFVAEGQVWLVRQETTAAPLSSTGQAARSPTSVAVPGGTAAGGTAAASDGGTLATADRAHEGEASGTVARLEAGSAVIDLGRDAGLRSGTTIRILGTTAVTVPALDGEGVETREVERVVGTGRVTVTEPTRALVELDRGSRVHTGDRVEPWPGASRYPVAPERLGNIGEVGVAVRPLLALDTVGVAFINEAWVHWTFEEPWYLDARLAPMGLGWSRDGNPLSVAGLASGGYDSRLFSVGLGGGWSMLNSEPGQVDYGAAEADRGTLGEQVEFEDVNSAMAIVQQARLGARDGAHVVVRNTFLLVPGYEWVSAECDEDDVPEGEEEYYEYYDCGGYEETGNKFTFGGIAMRAAIPTGARADLVIDWGTGRAGALWVQGGVAAWLRGNGDKGSLGAEIAAGYGSLTGKPDDERIELYGPLVSVAVRWRM